MKENACISKFLQDRLGPSFDPIIVRSAPLPQEHSGAMTIVYEIFPMDEVSTVGDFTVMMDALVKVVAVAQGDDIGQVSQGLSVWQAAEQTRTVLKGAKGSNSYGTILSCQRETNINLPWRSEKSGVTWQQLGAIWRIQVQAARSE